jgi:3-hydroxybutyryl-CoA dehydrogenase
VRAGRLGRFTGLGFYDHRAGAKPRAAPPLAPAESRPRLGVALSPGLLGPLAERLVRAGLDAQLDTELDDDCISIDGTLVSVTDGRTAAQRQALAGRPVILLDLARDFATTTLVGAAGSPAQLGLLAALLKPAGIEVVALADVAGLAVMRIVCCLANEAADVMTWSGTPAADIDTAMRLGTAYPLGPLAWADAIGVARVATVLAHLQAHYGDARYRRAPRLSAAQYRAARLCDG